MTPTPSTLSTTSSLALSCLITGLYVGGLYVARSSRLLFSKSSHDVDANGERARQANERWRDDDGVIRSRLKAAVISTSVNCVIVCACIAISYDSREGWSTVVRHSFLSLGLILPNFNLNALLPHLLTPLLYTGPLTARFLDEALPLQCFWSYQEHLLPVFSTWIGLRNYVLAPITEELVFRSCLLAIADLSGRGTYYKIYVTPLWFGAAHLHHAYDLYNRFGRTWSAFIRAVVTCLVQMTYTTIFGAYTSFLLLRTGSILPPITAHITANILGLPQLGWELHKHPKHKLLICVAYLVGVVGFAYKLGPWTVS